MKGQKFISFRANIIPIVHIYIKTERNFALVKFANCSKLFQVLKYHKGLKLQKDLHKLRGLDCLTPDVTEMRSLPSEITVPTFTLVWAVKEYEYIAFMAQVGQKFMRQKFMPANTATDF